MGLFGKIFDKKICDICEGEIGLLGNRKLDDGNLCKNCAAKLSPWFSDRRHSTVEQIREQLQYREENKAALESFNVTRSIGEYYKILIDETQKKFIVTHDSNWRNGNPDIIDLSQVTGCRMKVIEDKDEIYTKDKEGKTVSYEPSIYKYYYNFEINIDLNHPYFDNINFRVNNFRVEGIHDPEPGKAPSLAKGLGSGLNAVNRMVNGRPGAPKLGFGHVIDHTASVEYANFYRISDEMVNTLLQINHEMKEEKIEAAKPKAAVTCPYCGATTVPDASGCCEYCGGAVNG